MNELEQLEKEVADIVWHTEQQRIDENYQRGRYINYVL